MVLESTGSVRGEEGNGLGTSQSSLWQGWVETGKRIHSTDPLATLSRCGAPEANGIKCQEWQSKKLPKWIDSMAMGWKTWYKPLYVYTSSSNPPLGKPRRMAFSWNRTCNYSSKVPPGILLGNSRSQLMSTINSPTQWAKAWLGCPVVRPWVAPPLLDSHTPSFPFSRPLKKVQFQHQHESPWHLS